MPHNQSNSVSPDGGTKIDGRDWGSNWQSVPARCGWCHGSMVGISCWCDLGYSPARAADGLDACQRCGAEIHQRDQYGRVYRCGSIQIGEVDRQSVACSIAELREELLGLVEVVMLPIVSWFSWRLERAR